MGNYNFEDESKNFGETVRLDDISEEVRKRENIKFEDTQQFGNMAGKRGRTERMPQEKGGGRGGRPPKKNEIFTGNIIKLSIIGGIIVFVVIFAAVFATSRGSMPANDKAETENNNDISDVITKSDSIYAVIKDIGENRTIGLYNINEKKNIHLIVDSETIMTGANGETMGFTQIKEGDVVVVTEKGDTGTAETISVPSDIWRRDSVTGVEVDISANTVKYDDQSYLYGEDTYFSFEGNSIFPGDIVKADTVTLIGMGNMVFSARVEKSHGYIVIRNAEEVENMAITVDEDEVETSETSNLIEISSGSHTITIKGDNIEDYVVNLNIEDRKRSDIDLSKAKVKNEELGIIDLNVNVRDYIVRLNGELYSGSESIIQVPYGSVKVEIEKSGYEKWSTRVTVSEKPISVDVELKKTASSDTTTGAKDEKETGNLTIYSDPGWAKIYIDGEYKGVAPVMASLSYGNHDVRAELDGHDDADMDVTVNGPDKAVTIKFE